MHGDYVGFRLSGLGSPKNEESNTKTMKHEMEIRLIHGLQIRINL